MLDVGVVLGGVCDNVMYIVVPLPPADGEAAEKVGDQDADAGVDVEIMSDPHVAGVVGGEDQLVPEEAKKTAGEEVLGFMEEVHRERENEGVPDGFQSVGGVWAFVEPSSTYASVERAVGGDDLVLGHGVEGRVTGQIVGGI